MKIILIGLLLFFLAFTSSAQEQSKDSIQVAPNTALLSIQDVQKIVEWLRPRVSQCITLADWQQFVAIVDKSLEDAVKARTVRPQPQKQKANK